MACIPIGSRYASAAKCHRAALNGIVSRFDLPFSRDKLLGDIPSIFVDEVTAVTMRRIDSCAYKASASPVTVMASIAANNNGNKTTPLISFSNSAFCLRSSSQHMVNNNIQLNCDSRNRG